MLQQGHAADTNGQGPIGRADHKASYRDIVLFGHVDEKLPLVFKVVLQEGGTRARGKRREAK